MVEEPLRLRTKEKRLEAYRCDPEIAHEYSGGIAEKTAPTIFCYFR